MNDGKEVIAKVPNPNAGRPHFTTASEVATIDFARNDLGIPTPQVFAWSSSIDNAVGAEYIIMEKARGVSLEQLWPKIDIATRIQVIRAIGRQLRIYSNKLFSKIGSLYYTNDVPDVDSDAPLYVDKISGEMIGSNRFVIGPVSAREWTDHGRGSLECDRGPWNSVLEYRQAMARKETIAIQETRRLPKSLIMLCGPGLYQPTASKKLKTMDAFTKILPYILPDAKSATQSYLWHDDLHAENIFVDPEDPSQILSVIDWQSSSVVPLIDHTIQPALLNHDGSSILEMERPILPANLDTMSKDEQSAATRLFYDETLAYAFKIILQKHIEPVFNALTFQESSAASALIFCRRLFEIGEAHAMASIVALRDE
ncbi:hypothetical protein MBLNU459_g3626t1 [Dothideomycetes sp. NU459]